MMNVVLDTSTLIACFAKRSPYRPIFDALLSGKYLLSVSTDILLEYAEKIEQKTTPTISHNVLELLSNLGNVQTQNVYFFWNLIPHDPDDNKFTDCYVAAGADYLVSNDRHFNALLPTDFPPVQVISIEDFLIIVQRM